MPFKELQVLNLVNFTYRQLEAIFNSSIYNIS